MKTSPTSLKLTFHGKLPKYKRFIVTWSISDTKIEATHSWAIFKGLIKLAIEAKKINEEKKYLQVEKLGNKHLIPRIFEQVAIEKFLKDYEIGREELKQKIKKDSSSFDPLYFETYKKYVKKISQDFIEEKGRGENKLARIVLPKKNINFSFQQLITNIESIESESGFEKKEINEIINDLKELQKIYEENKSTKELDMPRIISKVG